MISALGSINIPVEDKSYKWSKKILKAATSRKWQWNTIVANL